MKLLNRIGEILLVIVVAVVFFFLGRALVPHVFGGIGFNNPDYYTVTHASVTCSSATSTSVVGVQTGRTSFKLTNNSTNTISICQAATCTAGATGIILAPNTLSFAPWQQDDAYKGAYSCIASTGSSTIGVSYSQ